jgi:SAM-dependent methyltransferase
MADAAHFGNSLQLSAMTSQERAFQEFADFAAKLKGDEKSEAQTFLFHLFEAFGHDANTLPEASTFEYRVRFPGQKTKFADLVWPGRVLIEMKSRGEKLSKHYQQTFDYWLNLVPHRPPYVVLCDFDEFWIYDFNTQLQEPLDRVPVKDLVARHAALNFLYPRKSAPIFGNNWVEVTREAAKDVASVFNSLVNRGESRESARRFVLQSVVAMFSEDIGLLPEDLFTRLLDECRKSENPTAASYDLIGGLFRQMNDDKPARGGRYAGVDYFNGGLFATVEPLELQPHDIGLLFDAAKEKWQYVQPVIFGTLFEGSLGKEERHALGAHFTYEADIQKIVRPTIVRPWEERIANGKNVSELLELLRQLRAFRVLDPACGSGNFLFVAYRALRELEQNLLVKLFAQDKRQFEKVGTASGISPKQFFGLDKNDNAVETAKVTLMLARRIASRQSHEFWDAHADVLPGGDTHALQFEKDLPLDNLDDNIKCADALFAPWPECDAIIGNPPFQSKNKMQQEFGPAYVQKLRKAYPQIPGRADFCVYWFRRAHDHLKPDQRAGLVGTNTIRQNYSREGGLDYIVANGGTILEAVSSQPWSGEAAVHVSIVNWLKGSSKQKRFLERRISDASDSPVDRVELNLINSSLSAVTDVSSAKRLHANIESGVSYHGQTHGHEGFLLIATDARILLKKDPRLREVLFPFLIGRELVSNVGAQPERYVIDFAPRDIFEAKQFPDLFAIVEKAVLPARLKAAKEEEERNAEALAINPKAKVNLHHRNFLNKWWQLGYSRQEMLAQIRKIPRYIACSGVTKRQIFEFVSSAIHPNDKLQVMALADDYSFGIISSSAHWQWFITKCTTLEERFSYNTESVFDTFPWPQSPKPKEIRAVAEAAVALRKLRHEIMQNNGWPLRELYKSLETPGENRLRDAHAALDSAVRAAYGMKPDEDILAFLLKLNLELAEKEANGESVTPPGLPTVVKDPKEFISKDCVTVAS